MDNPVTPVVAPVITGTVSPAAVTGDRTTFGVDESTAYSAPLSTAIPKAAPTTGDCTADLTHASVVPVVTVHCVTKFFPLSVECTRSPTRTMPYPNAVLMPVAPIKSVQDVADVTTQAFNLLLVESEM